MLEFEHLTVLLEETVERIDPRDGGYYVDGTVGGAGHSRRVLDRCGPSGRLLALDQDPDAVAVARERLSPYGDRAQVVHARFSSLRDAIVRAGFGVDGRVDGILVDLGVSSPQFDRAERGFSFRADAPLDMRMAQDGETAGELIERLTEAELATVFWRYGEIRASRRLARAVKTDRAAGKLQTTTALAELCERVLRKNKRAGAHPATLPFQALRIAVNDELGELERFLAAARESLAVGGTLAVISFHSLEDRLVKQTFAEWSRPPQMPRELAARLAPRAPFALHGKLIRAGDDELARNPRARSAKLRAVRRVEEDADA